MLNLFQESKRTKKSKATPQLPSSCFAFLSSALLLKPALHYRLLMTATLKARVELAKNESDIGKG